MAAALLVLAKRLNDNTLFERERDIWLGRVKVLNQHLNAQALRFEEKEEEEEEEVDGDPFDTGNEWFDTPETLDLAWQGFLRPLEMQRVQMIEGEAQTLTRVMGAACQDDNFLSTSRKVRLVTVLTGFFERALDAEQTTGENSRDQGGVARVCCAHPRCLEVFLTSPSIWEQFARDGTRCRSLQFKVLRVLERLIQHSRTSEPAHYHRINTAIKHRLRSLKLSCEPRLSASLQWMYLCRLECLCSF